MPKSKELLGGRRKESRGRVYSETVKSVGISCSENIAKDAAGRLADEMDFWQLKLIESVNNLVHYSLDAIIVGSGIWE
jgi:hypothetical protein